MLNSVNSTPVVMATAIPLNISSKESENAPYFPEPYDSSQVIIDVLQHFDSLFDLIFSFLFQIDETIERSGNLFSQVIFLISHLKKPEFNFSCFFLSWIR